jgi:acyl-CoA reductase-like NAD-dependent aldehyde dehydrogenase/predicted RNase H-like HicB family nuclease
MAGTQRTISPVNGSVYVERELASPAQIDRTLQRAVEAQREWQEVPLKERAALCLGMVEAMVGAVDEIAPELSWQMGRLARYTPNEIKGGFNERARYLIAAAERALADVQVEPKQCFTRFIRHRPLGVVLTLAPWNYPYLTSVNSVVPAIMAGNTMTNKIQYPRSSMVIEWSDEDDAYIVAVPELPGCVTHGATYAEAVRQGQDAIESWVDSALADGAPLPSPRIYAASA